MQTAEKPDISFGFRGIEIVQSSINVLHKPEINNEDFIFNIEVNQKIDAGNKLIFVFVRVVILLPDEKEEIGSLTTLCVFHVENFDAAFKMKGDKIEIPGQFMNTLSTISISTSRGVMFTFFRGTFLHKAILPIINPANLKPQPVSDTSII